MEHLTYDQLLKLVEAATEKSIFDYVTLVVSSAVTLLAVGMSYFFFKNHSNQVTNEKVIEKEVEKLYEAVDCLFELALLRNSIREPNCLQLSDSYTMH
ncbi:hypothetical protein HJ165_23435 [Vibrio parahaemolyticus]|nr:hypothetical protein [Vibrio parahaemolyticus]